MWRGRFGTIKCISFRICREWKGEDGVYWLCGFCALLAVLVIILLIKIYLMKKAAREIKERLAEKLASDTNTLITISSADKDMCQLASALNVELRELRKERHRLCQGDMELKDAIAGISHDLRTPLTAICGYLALLEREETSETVRQYLTQIENRTKAMKAMMEELLDYSVVASAREMQMETLCINDVLEECIASFYGVISKQGITPLIDITDVPVKRLLDKNSLMRIFGNIISNAIKHGDGDLSVKMEADGRIVFSNTAQKLSAVEAGRLFDRFYTVELARDSTGLGLSVAKLLTKQMEGKITAEYIEGKLFITLWFPPAQSPPGETMESRPLESDLHKDKYLP